MFVSTKCVSVLLTPCSLCSIGIYSTMPIIIQLYCYMEIVFQNFLIEWIISKNFKMALWQIRNVIVILIHIIYTEVLKKTQFKGYIFQ